MVAVEGDCLGALHNAADIAAPGLHSLYSQWSSADVSHGESTNHGPFSLSGLRWNAAPSLRNLKGEFDRGHKADDLDRAILGNDGAFLPSTYAQCLKRARDQCNTRREWD